MPEVHGEAHAEIRAAASWYEEQVTGLALKVVAEVEAAFERIDTFPQSGAPWRQAS